MPKTTAAPAASPIDVTVELDGVYYMSSTAWAKTSRDYKGTKVVAGVRERSVLRGGRGGTSLWPVTVLPDAKFYATLLGEVR